MQVITRPISPPPPPPPPPVEYTLIASEREAKLIYFALGAYDFTRAKGDGFSREDIVALRDVMRGAGMKGY